MHRFWAWLVLLAVLCGCSGAPSSRQTEQGARRIVSLVPSLTEDLCAIGAGRRLVGVSEYSSNSPCAKGVERVGAAAGIDVERIVRLHPDLVVGIPAQRLQVAPLVRLGLRVALMDDDSFASIFSNIHRLCVLTGRLQAGEALIARLRARTRVLAGSLHPRRHPSVFVVLQTLPIWTAGPSSYIATLIGMAGGTDAARGLRIAYAQYGDESLLQQQPDVLIAARDLHIRSVLAREPWRSLSAVHRGEVFEYDPNMMDRPGPHYNRALQWLIERLRPLER